MVKTRYQVQKKVNCFSSLLVKSPKYKENKNTNNLMQHSSTLNSFASYLQTKELVSPFSLSKKLLCDVGFQPNDLIEN